MKFLYYLFLWFTVLWGFVTILVRDSLALGFFVFTLVIFLLIRRKVKDRLKPIQWKRIPKEKPVKGYSNVLSPSTPASRPSPTFDIKAKVSSNSESRESYVQFRVAGITKTNEDGDRVQSILSQYVKDLFDEFDLPYQGMTNKEIIEDDIDEVYYFEPITSYDSITFVPEPDNKYSSRAIKVYDKELGHIGYVPEDDIDEVNAFFDKHKEYSVESMLMGGPKKILNDDNEVEIEKGIYVVGVRLIPN